MDAEPRPRSRRARRAGQVVALVLVALLAILSVVGIWARNQITKTDRYVRTVAPLATTPSIQDLIVREVTSAIADPERTADFAREVLPPRAAPLATPVAGAVERFVNDRVGDFVRSPRFATLWEDISRETHAAAVRLLTGEEEEGRRRIAVAGDLLVVRLGPLLGPVAEVLERNGLEPDRLRSEGGEPQLVIADASAIEDARGAVKLIERLAWVLPLLLLIALAAAIWLAPTRRRGVVRGGLAIVAGMLLLGFGIAAGRALYLDSVEEALGHDSAADVFDVLTTYLRRGLLHRARRRARPGRRGVGDRVARLALGRITRRG